MVYSKVYIFLNHCFDLNLHFSGVLLNLKIYIFKVVFTEDNNCRYIIVITPREHQMALQLNEKNQT